MITQMLANCAVADGRRAEEWYSRLFGRGPDDRPMRGLIEWHLSDGIGVQVWEDAERAGHSAVVLGVDDLDATVAGLNDAGIAHGGTQPGGGARILVVPDPDGNSIVFTGP